EFKNSDLNQFCGMKGIKREFSVPRTPQQNGIVERKNRTLIKVARTMLADSVLPIPFWAEAVNIVCYVQNRVLVTKPHNKTFYELLHGRTPSIGFMRPFSCPVTILNTLDSLGKFEGKVDEGFLAGYSVNSKAFISSGSINPRNNDEDVAFDGKEHDFDVKKPECEVILSPSSSAQSKKQDDKTKKEAKGKSPVESVTRYRDLNAEFEDYSDNSSNEVNAAGSIVPTVGQNSLNNTNTFSDAGPSNAAASPTYGKSLFIDAYQITDDPDMPELKRYVYQPPGFEDPDHPDKVKQKKDGIFISQDKYVAEILRKFGLTKGKSASSPIDTEKPLLKDSDGEDVDVHTYRSMIGSLMYLTSSRPDIMFACKKQTVFDTSSTKAEYVAAASCCAQVLWIQNQLLDYRLF
nr:retrovirus-related Pol polyprotein from transposon TNT 1-94 [Tanacetum cinerariifolium]